MLLNLLFQGGLLFTGPILIIFIASIILTILSAKQLNQKQEITKKIQWINSLGLSRWTKLNIAIKIINLAA